MACSVTERTSSFKPSSEITAPRYLKLVTVPSYCPFILISLWMPLALFVISLISIPYLVQVFSRMSASDSSPAVPHLKHLHVYHRQTVVVIFLPPLQTFPSYSSSAPIIIYSRKMLNRMAGRRHPLVTPTVILNHSPVPLFIWNALVAFSYSCLRMRSRFVLICTLTWWSIKLHATPHTKAFLK